MYGFSHDESHLLFIDCFGLTRLSAPKKLKTDRKITGSDAAGLASVSRDGSLAGSYEDIWNKSVVWTFPKLESAKRLPRFEAKGLVVHPEGTHYMFVNYGKLELEPLRADAVLLPLRLDAPPGEDEDEGAGKASLELGTGGEDRPPIVLVAGSEGRPTVPAPLRVAHDGTLVSYDNGVLICGRLEGERLTLDWRRRLHAPDNTRVDVYADRQRCVLCCHHGRRYTLVELREGTERRFEFDSLATPAFAGPYLAYQPSEATVRRRELDSGEELELSLEVYAKKRPIDLPNTGPATLFCGAGGRVVALARHRESLIDLVPGVEIPRKLPAKELELRQAVLAISWPYTEAARLAGVTIELGRVEIEAKRKSVSITHYLSGPSNLFGALLASHSHSAWDSPTLPQGWRMSGWGSHGGITASLDGLSLAQLVEGYAALTDAGVSFASTISFWADRFASSGWGEPPSDPEILGFLARALLASLDGAAKAALDYGALAKAKGPSLAAIKAGLDSYAARADDLPHDTPKLCGGLFNRLFGADAAELWAHCLFHSPAYTGGQRLWDFQHYALEPLLADHPAAAAPFRAWFEANELPDDDRRWTLEQLQQQLRQS